MLLLYHAGSGSVAGAAASAELPPAQSLERPLSAPPPAEGTPPAGIEGPLHAEATPPGSAAREALVEDERDRRSVRFAQDEPGGSAEGAHALLPCLPCWLCPRGWA